MKSEEGRVDSLWEKWKIPDSYSLNLKKRIMPSTLKYIVDQTGQKTSVLVPVKVWDDLNNNYQKLQTKLTIFNSLHNGLQEVKISKNTGRKLQTLKEFLK